MAYTAWSVVYGEQPTAAKWNQLGANDAGFKDGTNIDAAAIVTAKIADANITYAKLLSTIFSGQVTSATNSGTGGGDINYINLGGIKIAWGTTAQVAGTGNKTMVLPSFFTAIKAGTVTPSSPYQNTNAMTVNWASDITGQTTTLTITPIVVAGSSPSNKYSWFVIGT